MSGAVGAVQFRPRREADLGPLLAALRGTHQAPGGYPSAWPADPVGFLAPPALGTWVAEVDGVAVGQVALRPAPEPVPEWIRATGLSPQAVAVVSRLFIAPEHQGRGLARQLLRTAWAEARRLNLRAVLDVQTDTPAPIALYESEGWRRVAALPAPWARAEGPALQIYVYVSPDSAPA